MRSRSAGRYAFQIHESMHVIEEVLQTDLNRGAVDADAPQPLAAHRRLQTAEHMLHPSTYFGAALVFALLIRRQRLVLRSLERHPGLDALCA